MGAKTSFVTKDHVIKAPLPQHGSTYTVIPHSFVIDQTQKCLASHGLRVKHELYKTTKDGQIAQGLYLLDAGNDNEMGMMFAWSNSYDKSMRFKCAVGAHVFVCLNGVVSGDMANWKRKHTGTADQETILTIQAQISKAQSHYDQLVEDKEMLKNITLSKRKQAELLGRLFADEDVITLTQLGIVKRELEKPSYHYGVHADSAWTLYNHLTLSLKESHPSDYLTNHQDLHRFFVSEFGQLVQHPVTVQQSFDFDQELQEEEREESTLLIL
jgi:hypothetical protein